MRVEYVEMRRTKKYNLNWFYNYYIQEYEKLKDEKVYKQVVPPETFFNIFNQILHFYPQDIFDHLDRVFDVVLVYNKEGREL